MAAFLKLVWILASLFTFLDIATADCPNVNTAVNCSFEASDDCLSFYKKHDKHGLKWSSRSGAIQNGQLLDKYGRRTQRKTILSASPKAQYLYVGATSDRRAVGHWTDLVSPPLTADRQGCLYFLFHNNVCGDVTDPQDVHFKVSMYHYSDVKGMYKTGSTLLREYPCIYDEAWYTAQIPVFPATGVHRIVFSAKQHSEQEKNIAVDHVTNSDQSCSTKDDFNYETGDCGFEDSDLCGYELFTNETTQLKWMPVQKEMLSAQLNNSVHAPEGYFLCLWGRDDRNAADIVTTSFRSPQVS